MTIIEGKRYDLDKFYKVPGADTRENGGVKREGVWVTKTGLVIVKTYSIWESSRHDGVVGSQFHFADAGEIASLAAELNDEALNNLVPMANDF